MDTSKPLTYFSCSQECVLKKRHYATRKHLTDKNMSVAKPLTYLSLKCVLKYTNPNIR
ncbi:hypothetical protein CRE_14567 [Caenorhabditis remanei]|uniref:Uncharacterized protein n=1 Tax=Caenorhabditis remanei TaxID=31234 RepID=E3M9K1_CAERE|nr:hypothetical protein CRE_14567 [Caenorhabditis remanei]